jgi:carbon storage regulator CsrA
MLVLSRKVGERIVIGDGITVVVNRVSGNRVAIGIDAPDDVKILLIYSRERHPGDPAYLEYKHPVCYQEKLDYAKEFSAFTHATILVDGFNQEVLTLYNKLPNHCYVINPEREIIFKSGWASTEQIDRVLELSLTAKVT